MFELVCRFADGDFLRGEPIADFDRAKMAASGLVAEAASMPGVLALSAWDGYELTSVDVCAVDSDEPLFSVRVPRVLTPAMVQ